jgi:hypothetical protein
MGLPLVKVSGLKLAGSGVDFSVYFSSSLPMTKSVLMNVGNTEPPPWSGVMLRSRFIQLPITIFVILSGINKISSCECSHIRSFTLPTGEHSQ